MAGLLGGRYKDKGRQPWSARQAGEAAHPGRARAPGAPPGFPGGISEGTRRSWRGANPRGGEKLPFQHAKRRDVGVKATQVEKAARAAVQSRPRCAPAAARAAPGARAPGPRRSACAPETHGGTGERRVHASADGEEVFTLPPRAAWRGAQRGTPRAGHARGSRARAAGCCVRAPKGGAPFAPAPPRPRPTRSGRPGPQAPRPRASRTPRAPG